MAYDIRAGFPTIEPIRPMNQLAARQAERAKVEKPIYRPGRAENVTYERAFANPKYPPVMHPQGAGRLEELLRLIYGGTRVDTRV